MSTRTTIILVLVLAVLGGFYLYSPSRQVQEAQEAIEEATTTDSSLVFGGDLEANDIETITLEPADGAALSFTRERNPANPTGPSKWQMTAPYEAAAESWQVDTLARLLAELTYRATFSAGDENAPQPAAAGLEPPRLVVRFTKASGDDTQEFALKVGKNVALGTGTYAATLADDSPFYITADDLNERIKTEISDYRAKTVMQFTQTDATRLEISYDGVAYDFTKTDDGKWVINEPVQAFAKPSEMTTLLGNISRLRAIDFLAEDAATPAYGFGQPFVSARVTIEEQVEAEPPAEADPNAADAEPTVPQIVERYYALAIGAPADLEITKRFASRPNESGVFTLEQSAVDNLRPQLSKLRDNAVTSIAVNALTALTLTRGDEALTVTRKDGDWTTAADFGAIDKQAIREWTEAFAQLRAIDFVDDPSDLANYGLTEPQAKVTAQRSDSPDALTLEIGAKSASGRNAFVKIAGRPTVYVVTAENADAIAIDPVSLSSRELFNFQPNQLARLSLQRENMSYVFDQANPGTWNLLEPQGATSNMPNIFGAVTDLTRLRAVRVLNPTQAGTDPELPNAELVLTLQLRDVPDEDADATAMETVEHTLRVQDVEDRVLARRNDSNALYELDRTVYDAFMSEMINTKLFTFPADEIAGYRVSGPQFNLNLKSTNDGWREANDEFIPLDEAKINETLNALVGLQVERYTAFGNADLSAFESATTTRIEITRADQQVITLLLNSVDQPVAWVEPQHAFTLPILEVEKLLKPLDHYVRDTTAANN